MVPRARELPIAVVVGSCVAQLVDNITYTISHACLPHLFEDMDLAGESKVGLITTMFAVGSLLTSVPSGFLSDRLGSRKIPLVLGAAGYAVSGCVLLFSHKLWHVLVYRFLNGMASGMVYPVSTAAVGDVYPHRLLGLQMSLLSASNNAGYMIGPVLGGVLYDHAGVRGVSGVIMAIGSILSLALALGIKEPLQIHDKLMERNVAASDSSELSSDKVMFADDIESTDLGSIDLGSSTSIRKDMPLWKLILKWQVFSASITTLSLAMLMSSLDNVLSIHMKDRFGETAAKTGLLFVLNGGVAIILAMPTGSAVDWVIGRYGESARSLVQLSGLLLTSGAIFAIGMSTSFRMIIGVEAWLSMALLAVNIPVMSSFGDFVNSLGLNSMAQSYGVYNSFWAASSTVAPPVATWLYTRIGFRTMVAGLLTGLSLLCASLFLAELVWRTCKSWTKPSSLSSR